MEAIATGVATAGIRVFRFEFPYMRQRRATAVGGLPTGQAVLLQTWHEVIDALGGAESLVIGGRSMGGRMASLIADAVGARGLVCLGYPFHPPGKPEKLRTQHLAALCTPTLIVQGERDAFGSRAEVETYDLSDDPHPLARRRRPLVRAAQEVRPHRGRASRRGGRGHRGVHPSAGRHNAGLSLAPCR